MTFPTPTSLPPQYNTSWYGHYSWLDAVARATTGQTAPSLTSNANTTLLFDGTNGGTADSLGRQGINTAQWTYDLGGGETPIGSGDRWGNWEAQIYTSAITNVHVVNGQLHIRARYESPQVSSPTAGELAADYSSGRIHTQGKVAIAPNSYVETRITFPTCPGTWGAFWAMGVNYVRNADNSSNWPYCGEIDTAEIFGQHPHATGFACHYTAAGTANDTNAYTHHQYTGWDNSTALYRDPAHAIDRPTYYGFWTSGTEIRRYINRKQTFALTQTQVTNAGGQWPFNQNLFLLLNLAVGGQASPKSTGLPVYVDSGMLPEMVVDPINIWTGVTNPSTLGLS